MKENRTNMMIKVAESPNCVPVPLTISFNHRPQLPTFPILTKQKSPIPNPQTMYSSSSAPLRRSTQSLLHHRLQFRPISTAPLPSIIDSNFQQNPNNNTGYNSRPLLKWISGIVTGSALGVGLYWYSSPISDYSIKSILSVSDWLTKQSALYFDPSSRPKFLFQDAFRRKIFFNYEKRIRLRSPPEKVFEYFASFKIPGGKICMTPADLMRAVVPVFPPSESNLVRDGYLPGERRPGELHCAHSEFFMLFDMNNDGLISFKEYIFFVTLLSIPESSFSVAFKMFDIDNDGQIDMDEFKKVMALMRTHNRQGSLHRDGLRAGARVGRSVENGGLLQYFFGEDGKKLLQHDTFVQFLQDLHNEMIRLEFSHYDCKSQGTISAKDFALSMVASGDIRHLNKLLDRVDELDNEPHLNDKRISFEEFENFAELRKKLHPFSVALFSYGQVNGLLTRKDFQRAASQVCGVSLSDNVIEIIFHIFDANRDGSLCSAEFVRILQNRKKDIAQPTGSGFMNI